MNKSLQIKSINNAVKILNEKEVIAYPTESVFGIGCDPDNKIAINRLLKIKKRSIEKGLILVAADFAQIKPYIVDSNLTSNQWQMICSSWPGPVTFIFPSKLSTPYWLTGRFNSIAVRVTDNPLIVSLCRAFGKPIVSTSANISGVNPCYTAQEVHEQFGNTIPIIGDKIGNNLNPSEIRDVLTGKYFRKNN